VFNSAKRSATQHNLELVFGSDSRFTEESRGMKYFYIPLFHSQIQSDKGLTRSQCATSDVLSRDETATDLLARDARSQEAYEAANGMDLKLPSRIRLAAHVENESWQHRHGFKC
jgi:hypothetical protein